MSRTPRRSQALDNTQQLLRDTARSKVMEIPHLVAVADNDDRKCDLHRFHTDLLIDTLRRLDLDTDPVRFRLRRGERWSEGGDGFTEWLVLDADVSGAEANRVLRDQFEEQPWPHGLHDCSGRWASFAPSVRHGRTRILIQQGHACDV
jgi:hypothetical protein